MSAADGAETAADGAETAADGVGVSIEVDVAPDIAFDVFTREIDAWWQRGPRYRFMAPYGGTMTLEAGVGGRLLHLEDSGQVFVVGRIEVWEPPRRLALTWRLPNFAPDQITRVEVRFEPVGDATRVSVMHNGWDQVPARHPARHGLTGRDFVLFRGQWLGDLLMSVKRRAEARNSITSTGGDQP